MSDLDESTAAESSTELTVKVPDVGEGVAEVEIVSWSVAEGQTVTRDETIAEVMTDKATVEVPSPIDGVVRQLGGAVGDILLVGSPLFTLAVSSGSVAVAEAAPSAPAATVATSPPRQIAVVSRPEPAETEPAGTEIGTGAVAEPGPAETETGSAAAGPSPVDVREYTAAVPRAEGRKPTASPAVRKRARDAGIDLRMVAGTGPAGRIEHADLDALFDAANRGAAAPARRAPSGFRARNNAVSDQPIVGIRRKIAEQMVDSTTTIPHITYVEEVDMTALEDLRKTLNERSTDGTGKLTILPFLIRALVNELANHPSMNAHVIEPEQDEGRRPATLRTFGGIHVGIATQTEGGLVVPVLRHAEAESLWSTATRIAELAEAARNGTAVPADMTGSTVTITSLGALGGLVTTPVINKPETTIIGVNKMVTRPVWIDDAFVPRLIMNLSSSFDHRVIDGWDAANFVQGLKQSLEQPALLFVDQPSGERP